MSSGASAAFVAASSLFSAPPMIGTPVAAERATLLSVTGAAGGAAGAGAFAPIEPAISSTVAFCWSGESFKNSSPTVTDLSPIVRTAI
ncbi:hypothetical protein [Bradyrhizobium sp. th.b2]|uniref:hypothetical protein n=1 Tax=Bradyrhizobium sp. th-b2 TaxID=172088 RepID=UPI0012EBD472|nr:hypothetical protein [Bradyrhizobium sp. th.b2]